MNFGFIVPTWLVLFSMVFAITAPGINLGLSLVKAKNDFLNYLGLRGQKSDDEASGVAAPQEVLDRMGRLRREQVANVFGVSAALCVFGTGIAVTYPATEPHALALTSLFGLFIFLQFAAREFQTTMSLLRSIPQALWNIVAHPRETMFRMQKKKETEGSFWTRTKSGVQRARALVKKKNEEKRAKEAGFGFFGKLKHRVENVRASLGDWAIFFRTYRAQRKAKAAAEKTRKAEAEKLRQARREAAKKQDTSN